MTKNHNLLATSTSEAINKTFGSSNSTPDFIDKSISPNSSNSVLTDQLILAMSNAFLDFNLQPILKVLKCIKHSPTFHSKSVWQDFYVSNCRMVIRFSNDKNSIKVSILKKTQKSGNSQSFRAKTVMTQSNRKYVETVRYLEEVYKTDL